MIDLSLLLILRTMYWVSNSVIKIGRVEGGKLSVDENR